MIRILYKVLNCYLHGEIATPVASETTLTASEKAQTFFLSMVSGEISVSSSEALSGCW